MSVDESRDQKRYTSRKLAFYKDNVKKNEKD